MLEVGNIMYRRTPYLLRDSTCMHNTPGLNIVWQNIFSSCCCLPYVEFCLVVCYYGAVCLSGKV